MKSLLFGNVIPAELTGEKITELSWKKSLAKLWPEKNKGEIPQAAETENLCFIGNWLKLFCATDEIVLLDGFDEIDVSDMFNDFDIVDDFGTFDRVDEFDDSIIFDVVCVSDIFVVFDDFDMSEVICVINNIDELDIFGVIDVKSFWN